MPGKLTLEELRAAVEAGEIDTVLAVQPDMQGRLMGKRFQAEFFLEGAVEETHSWRSAAGRRTRRRSSSSSCSGKATRKRRPSATSG